MNSPLDMVTNGPIQVWTINVPHLGNAITDTGFVAAFEAAVDDANADAAIRAVILTGMGKIFSGGGNVKDMADGEGMFGLAALDQRRACSCRAHRQEPCACAADGQAPAAGVTYWLAGINAGDGRGHATACAPRSRARPARREVEYTLMTRPVMGWWIGTPTQDRVRVTRRNALRLPSFPGR